MSRGPRALPFALYGTIIKLSRVNVTSDIRFFLGSFSGDYIDLAINCYFVLIKYVKRKSDDLNTDFELLICGKQVTITRGDLTREFWTSLESCPNIGFAATQLINLHYNRLCVIGNDKTNL